MSKFAGIDYRVIGGVAGLLVLGGLTGFGTSRSGSATAKPDANLTVNLGFFANVTHSPALIAVSDGAFDKALGHKVALNTEVLNAGPEAMEALAAGYLDVVYVGPSPALNSFIKANNLRIVSGVCEGGASLVATPRSGIHTLADLGGKKVAVPQLGNTQDVSLRHFMKGVGLAPKEGGGTVEIIPVQNADTLTLFKQGSIDAAWVPEPWATRLVQETGATRVVDERSLWPKGKFTTTVLVARYEFLQKHSDVVRKIAKVNRDTIDWMAKNPEEAHAVVNNELYQLAGKHIAKQVPNDAWNYLAFSGDLDFDALGAAAKAAHECGYLKYVPANLAEVFDPRFLSEKGTRVAE
jgi:NitT/TauT family transport system substrate-binding protein